MTRTHGGKEGGRVYAYTYIVFPCTRQYKNHPWLSSSHSPAPITPAIRIKSTAPPSSFIGFKAHALFFHLSPVLYHSHLCRSVFSQKYLTSSHGSELPAVSFPTCTLHKAASQTQFHLFLLESYVRFFTPKQSKLCHPSEKLHLSSVFCDCSLSR